jgi:MOSC domain-containing protein YiiM
VESQSKLSTSSVFFRLPERGAALKIIRDLKVEHFQNGRVEWIGLCTARRGVVEIVSEANVKVGTGLVGDHHALSGKSERQVTMIQHEHLVVVASILNRDEVRPEEVRRNLVISGMNLIALKDQTFRIGDAILEGTGPCVPCSRMTEVLGPGGYNAMRGHGGITVRVLQAGTIRVGDEVVPISEPIEDNDQASRQKRLFS